jgi:uncharacterized protein (TIGR00255 family)
MTGYGRGIKTNDEYSVMVDIKSINHRYLELYFKLPKPYYFLEDRLRRDISGKISRGKLEIIVSVERFNPVDLQVQVDKILLNSYVTAIQEIRKEFKLTGRLTLTSVLNLPNIFKAGQLEEDQDKLIAIASMTLADTLNSLLEMRKMEGSGLCRDLQSKLVVLDKLRHDLRLLAPEVVGNYQEKLTKRIQELAGGIEIDPGRLATEVAIFADKADIHEELIRIESHIQQFLNALPLNEPIGRKLDFIIQELNREINTIGSKASDLRIAQIVIEFKSELEKIREQIQNIE